MGVLVRGVRVALATPTASPPPWFSLAHPDALPVTREGVRLSHGSRDTYCVAAPAYRAAAQRIARALGERYAGHPALALWHVHNEYGTWCYCDHIAVAFRRWLRDRYGELDRINEAWSTAVWSQWYSDWAQILPPRATQYLSNPAHALDFRRFLSDELLAAFREQRDLLHELAPGVPVTTNFVFGAWVPVDHHRWAREVDLVAIDDYPSADDGAEQQTAFAADLARGWAGGCSWLLMEQAPSTIDVGPARVTKPPGRMARLSLSHVARGSRGAMFFQWRASRGGAEQHHSAMVPHAGPDTRVHREIVALGAELARLSAEVRQAHRALWRAGIATDVVHPLDDLSRYRFVVVPCLYLMPDEAVTALESYVDAGGQAFVTYLSGTVDATCRVRPGGLGELVGVWIEEHHPLPSGVHTPLSTGDSGRTWREHLHLVGAEPVITYADDGPALTRFGRGAGAAWYLSTGLDDEPFERVVRAAVAQAAVAPVWPDAPPGVEVVRRVAGGGSWIFVLNHTSGAVVVPGVGKVPAGGFAVVEPGRGRPGSARADAGGDAV